MRKVSVNMSTFLIDLNQMAIALTSCTERSLVIIDEFGKVCGSVCGYKSLFASRFEAT